MSESRFTQYGAETAGMGYHTVKSDRDGDGWTLTLRFTAWGTGDTQDVTIERVGPEAVRYPDGHTIELRPSSGANALVHRILGTAWSALDKGRGYTVALAL